MRSSLRVPAMEIRDDSEDRKEGTAKEQVRKCDPKFYNVSYTQKAW